MFVDFDWTAALAQSPILIVLILCSVVTLGFAIERLSYYHKRNGNTDTTMRKAMSAIQGGRFDEAINHFQDLAHPLGPVAINTLDGFRRAPGEAEEIMHVMLNQQKLLLERNTGLLGTMAAVTPLIGLLGTVLGIMVTFQTLGSGAQMDVKSIMVGLSLALKATAAGIAVAIPCVVLNNILRRKAREHLAIFDEAHGA